MRTIHSFLLFGFFYHLFFLNFKGKLPHDCSVSNLQLCDTVTNWQVANGTTVLFEGYSTSDKSTLPQSSVNFSDISNITITYNFCSKTLNQPISFELCEFNDKGGVMNFDERKILLKKEFKTNNSNVFEISKNEISLLKIIKKLTFVMFYGKKYHYLGQLRIKK